MIVLGFDAPGGKVGAWAIYDSVKKRVLNHAVLLLHEHVSEQDHYAHVAELLDAQRKKHDFTVVALEHPFLYRIAQWIGGVKMWVSLHPDMTWYMLTNSSARKAVFGDAKRPAKLQLMINVDGQLRRLTAKTEILLTMRKWTKEKTLTQHEADALLYAMAAAVKLEELARHA